MTTTRELELIHRAEAAERAIVEAVRQRDILLSACEPKAGGVGKPIC